MSLNAVQIASPKDYEYVYQNFRSFLYGVVYRSGVPHYCVEDASHEIIVRMLLQDGLDRFEGHVHDAPPRLKAYLATYFSLGARAERSRIQVRTQRSVALSALPDLEDDAHPSAGGSDLLEVLLTRLSGDARHFVEVAAEHASYPKARAALAAEGWDSPRIRRAVREARATTREYRCTAR